MSQILIDTLTTILNLCFVPTLLHTMFYQVDKNIHFSFALLILIFIEHFVTFSCPILNTGRHNGAVLSTAPT